MASLNFTEKMKFEKLFDMGTGYVLDFSNRTFQEFVFDSVGKDIYDDKYDYSSGSKANRLRGFWEAETNHIVGKLLLDLLEHWLIVPTISGDERSEAEKQLYEQCKTVAEKLESQMIVENADVIHHHSDEERFALLVKSLHQSINSNQPEAALDRLHTYMVSFVRELCKEHAISFGKDTPLHSLFGGYVKHLEKSGAIESDMTIRILKSSISVLESFNKVRNHHSFAHDNQVLNYDESVLILNNVCNTIKFIQSIEKKLEKKAEPELAFDDEIPF